MSRIAVPNKLMQIAKEVKITDMEKVQAIKKTEEEL